MENSFGSQIRNYVLYPYRLIKDTRSNIESGNVEAALDGDIDDFVIRVSPLEGVSVRPFPKTSRPFDRKEAMNSLAAKEKACDIRTDIIEMLHEAGSGHPGGSLSCTDIMTALYFGGVLDHDPENPSKEDRDRFIMAKGHAAPALLPPLPAGYLPVEELKTLRKIGSRLQGHPDSNLCPGVEVSTGSLGQGLSIAAGRAGVFA